MVPNAGAYTESAGILGVRQEIAQFLFERDGYEGNPGDIFLTNGASEGVRLCMQTIIRDPNSGFKDGVLTPIPQYPLYSALTTLLNGNLIPYYLNEEKGWDCTVSELKSSLSSARSKGISPRALVVINPGNPTGQLLSQEGMVEIINFCRSENICLMADEVYQENVWKEGAKFYSFRKVAFDMGAFKGKKILI
jgi:alanine transaminase